MGRRSKRKGAGGERELAAELTWLLDVEAYRGRQYHGGPDAPDVKVSVPGLNIECKRAERFGLYQALEQSAEDAAGGVPVVCYRKNRKPWVLVCYLRDLPRLVGLLRDRVG